MGASLLSPHFFVYPPQTDIIRNYNSKKYKKTCTIDILFITCNRIISNLIYQHSGYIDTTVGDIEGTAQGDFSRELSIMMYHK